MNGTGISGNSYRKRSVENEVFYLVPGVKENKIQRSA